MSRMHRVHGAGRLVSALVAVVMVGPLLVVAPALAGVVAAASAPGGSYVALTPARIADTRSGAGGVPTGPTTSLVISTAGRAGIPATGVTAIAVNITVTGASAPGYVMADATGSPQPGTSNVNFGGGQTVSQMAVVPVNAAGRFTLEASSPTQLIVDVEGYFTSRGTATTRGLFNPLDPARLMNSRSHFGAGPPGPGGTSVLQVTGRGGVPATGVSAVVINTTVTGPTKAGYVTDYPTGSARPITSTVSFMPGQTTANRLIVPVGVGGKISFYNAFGTSQLMVDVTGYFTDGLANTAGGYYVPVTVTRVVDTRFWQTSSPLSTRALQTQKIAGQTCVLSPDRTVCGRALVPPLTAPARPIAALLTITAIPSGTSGHLTAFPAGTPTPPSSDVNFAGSAAASNLAFVALGSRGEVSVRDSAGFAYVVEDVSGYFALPAATLGPGRVPVAKNRSHPKLTRHSPASTRAPLSSALVVGRPGLTAATPAGPSDGGDAALPMRQHLTRPPLANSSPPGFGTTSVPSPVPATTSVQPPTSKKAPTVGFTGLAAKESPGLGALGRFRARSRPPQPPPRPFITLPAPTASSSSVSGTDLATRSRTEESSEARSRPAGGLSHRAEERRGHRDD